MSVEDARAFVDGDGRRSARPGPRSARSSTARCPARPATSPTGSTGRRRPGPHPIVVYFHGGGWVLGSPDSDDPFCRDLCVRSGAVVVSVDYRHAPEARFPAAVDDGFAAVAVGRRQRRSTLGGIPGQLAVCGWSAGGNIAAVVCQLARDAGGPAIAGQVLVTPVTDCDFTRASYVANADGYMLTTRADAVVLGPLRRRGRPDRSRASPLRAEDLSDLPPALIVTCEFDPLRDEGAAYAEALAAAGDDVRHLAVPRPHAHVAARWST